MDRRFFSLEFDPYAPGRWYLDEPTDLARREVEDIWEFRQGQRVELRERLRIPIYKPGKPLDFDTTTVGRTPILSARAAAVFRELAPSDAQLFPVDVEGQPEPYYLLNVAREIRCIDDKACAEVQVYPPEDRRAGEYRSVSGLRIDTSRVGDARVFRLWGWHSPIVVDEKIKEALEHAGIVGAVFEDVTGPTAATSDDEAWHTPHQNPEMLRQVRTAREAAFREIGELSEETFTPIVPYGDAWPSMSQAWRIIRRPGGRTLCVSDGLSDPFHDSPVPSCGYGLELAIETDEPLADNGGWLLQLLIRVSDEVAEHEHLRKALVKGALSMEVLGEDMPEPLVTKDKRVGVLLGMEASTLPASFPTPAGDVRFVTVTALLPKELAFLLKHGKAELLVRFAKSGEKHLSRSWRTSVV